jgi:hypothetical protein
MNALMRVGLWLSSLLLAVAVFSLIFCLLQSVRFSSGSVFLIFRVTLLFAFPIWCVSVPLVTALKDAEERRIWTILLRGSLIGPAAVALWCLILQLRGAAADMLWQGDPLIGIGGSVGIVLASIVGFLATSFYVIALKVLHRRSSLP